MENSLNSANSISKFFWIFFGMTLAIPYQITDGLLIGYFQILYLLALNKTHSKTKLILVLIFISLVIISTINGTSAKVESIINPILTSLVFLIHFEDQKKIKLIFKGIYISLTLVSFYMIYAFLQEGISTWFMLLNTRDWAQDYISFMGNGFAILVSLLIVKTAKEAHIKYLLLFAILGILTTSRIPIYTIGFLITFYSFKNIVNVKNFFQFLIIMMIVFSFAIYSNLIEEFGSLAKRIFYANDRLDVYALAFQIFTENPLLGIGSEKLPYFIHAHNSYLHVLSKYGIFAFFIWLTLIYFAFFTGYRVLNNLDFLFVFLIISSAQIGLHHAHAVLIILLYCNYLKNIKIPSSKKSKTAKQ